MTPLPFVPATHEDHARLGDWYRDQGRLVEAQAQYRTAVALGHDDPAVLIELAAIYLALGRSELVAGWCDRARAAGPDLHPVQREALAAEAGARTPMPLETLDHNRYFRLKTLAEAVARLAVGLEGRPSVLDIGGGDGMLALFLPDVDYVLAEPGTNGLSGESLPFDARSFDVVLACHVLEHVPADAREGFLETLCRVARRHVVLLNPFRPAEETRDAWLELVAATTGAPWAHEHLACGFPSLDFVTDFAARRGLPCQVEPNGMRLVSTLHVLLSHYAALARRSADLPRINALLNAVPGESLHDREMATAWLVTVACGSGA